MPDDFIRIIPHEMFRDNNGNLLRDHGQLYVYDGFNRIHQVLHFQGALKAEYLYYPGTHLVKFRFYRINNQDKIERLVYNNGKLIEVYDVTAAQDPHNDTSNRIEQYVYTPNGRTLVQATINGKTYQVLPAQFSPDKVGALKEEGAAKPAQNYRYGGMGYRMTVLDENFGTIHPNQYPNRILSRVLFDNQVYDPVTDLLMMSSQWVRLRHEIPFRLRSAPSSTEDTYENWRTPLPRYISQLESFRQAVVQMNLANRPAPNEASAGVKTPGYQVIQGDFGNVIELEGQSTMICHGVDRFRNVMVGPPNSFANVPGLRTYVMLRDVTARTTFEVGGAVLIPGSIAATSVPRFFANSLLQSAKFSAVHEGFGAVALGQEMSGERFVETTAAGVFLHGTFSTAGRGLQVVAQSKPVREIVLVAALKNPFPRFPGASGRAATEIRLPFGGNPPIARPSPIGHPGGISEWGTGGLFTQGNINRSALLEFGGREGANIGHLRIIPNAAASIDAPAVSMWPGTARPQGFLPTPEAATAVIRTPAGAHGRWFHTEWICAENAVALTQGMKGGKVWIYTWRHCCNPSPAASTLPSRCYLSVEALQQELGSSWEVILVTGGKW